MSTSEHADYTPTTEEVRRDFAYPWEGHTQDEAARLAAFDRWFAALASTPSPAQPTEASERIAPFLHRIRLHLRQVEGGNGKTMIDREVADLFKALAPSPVQGADDRLAQAEAIIAAAQVLADANQVDHSGHIDADGEPCGEGRTWHDRWARNLHVILATYQQSPQAALNEVRAGALEDAANNWSEWEAFTASDGVVSLRQHGRSPQQILRDRAAELRAAPQTGDAL